MPTPDFASPDWADIVPVPQNEGGPNPLAAIAYSETYSQASDYLRAVMAANEKSQRALELTEHIITMNPAHYTVWVYRASILKALGISPEAELQWLTATSLKNLKNYQIWQHRQVVISQLATIPDDEADFLGKVLAKDTKNYHVWSYRQWLVKHFKLWAEDSPGGESELMYTDKMISEDVRNNSAWNHRYFVTFRKPEQTSLPATVIDREIQYAKDHINLAPQNQSTWNYLRGVLKYAGRPITDLKSIAQRYADIEDSFDVTSSYALDILADIWAAEREDEKASKAFDMLGEKYDPIRKNYWQWRKSKLVAVPTA